MKRLFWIGVGAAAAVVAIRKVGDLVDRHTPPGVAQAVGVIGGLRGALRAARSEFTAGLAERETELRHDLLGDVDLDEARTRTDAWRAERREARAQHRPSGRGPRRGRHADALTEGAAEDPGDDDGELGYSFF